MNLLNVGLKFFLTGSFMLFLHRLLAETVRYTAGMEDTIHISTLLYLPSFFFIILGAILLFIALAKWAKQ